MTTFALPLPLEFLDPPLLDDLSTLPEADRAQLHQRMLDDPALAHRMALALFDMVMVQGAMLAAEEDVLATLFARLAGKVREDDPEVLALRHRHLLHAGHTLLNQVHATDRPRLAQRLLRLNTLLSVATLPGTNDPNRDPGHDSDDGVSDDDEGNDRIDQVA